jgi:hypothetical protein
MAGQESHRTGTKVDYNLRSPMSIVHHFARDYSDARARFQAAAHRAGAKMTPFQHPLRGPGMEKLFTDLAWWGPEDAERVLVTVSATHGVEGFCGSLCQTAWFAEGMNAELPPGTALAAIHAINPHGFAWIRRVTEDNVDLNRNFVDHSHPYPVNAGYEELKDAITPADWSDGGRAAADARLAAYGAKHGAMALQTAVTGGQYSDPLGIFFGGHAPTWSNRTLIAIFKRFLSRAKHVALIDFHTGLGPYGHGELITGLEPGTANFKLTRDWLGDELTSPLLGNSASAKLFGINQLGMEAAIPQARFAAVAIEYGIAPVNETREALRADNWLHVHGDLGSPQAKAIKAEMRRVFYGDTDQWKTMVWERNVEINRRLLKGLAEG